MKNLKKHVRIIVVVLAIVIVSAAGLVMARNNMRIDEHTTKLYAGGMFNKEKKVNTPKLVTGMTAIKWEDGEVVKIENPENDNSWYDYNSGKWANAMTEDGSMWVWIPRYTYQIESNYHSDQAGTIKIKFLKGTTDETAEGERPEYSNVSGEGNWLIHPAFTNTNNTLGIGWDEDIEGFWVAKFEAGRGTVESPLNYGSSRTRANEEINTREEVINYPTFKPDEIGINYMNSNDIYLISKELVKEGNPYGLDSTNVESMQITNAQWGAVAYLTWSFYGTDGKKVEVNDLVIEGSEDLATARTGGENYKINVGQSSTLNIYGVYDLAGGSWERVAALLDNGNDYVRVYYPDLEKDKNTRYVDLYKIGLADVALQNYNANKDKYGDAIWETSIASEGNMSWNSNYSRTAERRCSINEAWRRQHRRRKFGNICKLYNSRLRNKRE